MEEYENNGIFGADRKQMWAVDRKLNLFGVAKYLHFDHIRYVQQGQRAVTHQEQWLN